ncbi:MAG: TM0996/MTH895 family glutaredoxin-like protein [Candidatus Omnitrophica bacterium]|nr:TM0996/MTH895 family glutaredoxin-like protein [Candidatus Omnitrophota bacterium]
MKIEILGMGCPKCKKLFENAQAAAKELNIQPDITKIEQIDQIVQRGVMTTPALVIDGKVKAAGSVPDVVKIKEFIVKG